MLLLAGDLGGADLALDPAAAEPARDQDPVGLLEARGDRRIADVLGVDPVDLDLAVVVGAGVAQRLDHRQVGVLEPHVLADQRDPHAARSPRSARSVIASQPLRSGSRGLDPEVLGEDEVIDALGAEHQRHLVDVGHVVGGHDGLDRQAGEQRDLAADVGRRASTPSGTSPCPARYRCAAVR